MWNTALGENILNAHDSAMNFSHMNHMIWKIYLLSTFVFQGQCRLANFLSLFFDNLLPICTNGKSAWIHCIEIQIYKKKYFKQLRRVNDWFSIENIIIIIIDHSLKIPFYLIYRENQPCQNLMFDRRVVRGSNFAGIQAVSNESKKNPTLIFNYHKIQKKKVFISNKLVNLMSYWRFFLHFCTFCSFFIFFCTFYS